MKRSIRRFPVFAAVTPVFFAALLLALPGIRTTARQAPAPAPRTERIAMRDGTLLATDIYLPVGPGPFPVVLLRTPYNKDAGAGIGAEGTRRGYAIVVQDTRGRYASAGDNLPFEGDGWWEGRRDGYDTLEWIARQSWCNGKIGTTGGSALGIAQLLVWGAGTDRIAAQQIQVATPSLYRGLFTGGILRKALVEDWLRASRFDPSALKRWTDHPAYDAFWQQRDLARLYSRVNAPAVHVGGWYDIFGQETINAFAHIQRDGGSKARGRQKLVMGPWTHGIFQERAGDLTFPGGRFPTETRTHDAWTWFDHWLKGIDNGVDREPAVAYYTMGDAMERGAPGNRWRTAPTWPPPGVRETPYYLHADHTLSARPPAGEAPLAYSYDPRDPVPTLGGPQLTIPAGAVDQRAIESRPDVLVFTGESLERPLEVTGRLRARLWVLSDAPDTDFFVRLCDVYPDGRSMNVCEGALRARFRRGLEREERMVPGKVYSIDIDLGSTSIVVNRRHRLRVQVTSSSAPGYDPNPNTGERLRASDRTRIARNTVCVDRKRPSQLILPTVPVGKM